MLTRLRGPSGGPALRVRVAAALVVACLVVATAPVVVLPIVRAIANALF